MVVSLGGPWCWQLSAFSSPLNHLLLWARRDKCLCEAGFKLCASLLALPDLILYIFMFVYLSTHLVLALCRQFEKGDGNRLEVGFGHLHPGSGTALKHSQLRGAWEQSRRKAALRIQNPSLLCVLWRTGVSRLCMQNAGSPSIEMKLPQELPFGQCTYRSGGRSSYPGAGLAGCHQSAALAEVPQQGVLGPKGASWMKEQNVPKIVLL